MRVTLFICLLMVAWLSAGAMAVRSASRIWLRHWAERRLRGATSVLLYLDRPQRLLAAANAAIALTLGFGGAWIGWRRGTDPMALTTMLLYTALVIVFGFVLPRAIARRWPSAIIPLVMPVLNAAAHLTAPLLAIGRSVAGEKEDREQGEASESREAMQDLLREGELEGVGGHEELAIITGVMEFGEKTVRDVMTPRSDIFAIPEGQDVNSVGKQIAESAFSRVPVYRDSLDHITGMYLAFDVLKERAENLPPLRPVAYASADSKCNDLLFRMLKARLHLAVVHDDRGQTQGIATLENLLEELVGDIRDEHDDPAAATPTVRPAP